MSYTTLKVLHVIFVLTTATGFIVRGFWRLTGSPHLQRRWVRVLPHVNDTLLLASGIAMAAMGSWNPLRQPWLMTKLVALVIYVVLGSVALKRGRRPAVIATSFGAAVMVLGYMLAVAVTHTPLPWTAW